MKKLMLVITLSLFSVLSHASVTIDLDSIDAAEKQCLKRVTSEMDMELAYCEAEAYDATDKVLNKVYSALIRNLRDQKENSEIQRRLTKSEKAWIAFRDAESSLQGAINLGGTGENLNVQASLHSLAKQRVLSLVELSKATGN